MADEKMGFDEYQNEALVTAGASRKWDDACNMQSIREMLKQGQYTEAALAFESFCTLANAAIGMGGEAGETGDLLKKIIFHGHSMDVAKVKKELGDQLWYISLCAWAAGLTMEEIAKANVLKLRERYKGGGFDPKLSQNRVEG